MCIRDRSISSTTTVVKLHIKAKYGKIFPTSSGIPNALKSKVMVNIPKIKPNKATGNRTFLGSSKSEFIIFIFQ